MDAQKITDLPFDEIASWFPPGFTSWIKRNSPEKWGKFLSIEKALNQASFELDEVRIEALLTEYRDFVKAMAQEFESRKKGRGNDFDLR